MAHILPSGGGKALINVDDAALLLLDHQTGLFQTVKDISVAELRANVIALARIATRRETLCRVEEESYLFTSGYVPWCDEFPAAHIPAPIEKGWRDHDKALGQPS